MSIPSERREQARQRAGLACEYCGVTETDSGGHLTIDHYRPQAQGVPDSSDNLVYNSGTFIGTLQNDTIPAQTFSFAGSPITLHDLAPAPEPSFVAALGLGALGLSTLSLRARRRA